MFGSFRLGTILGIPVGVNWSVLLIAWLIAFSLAGQLLPAQVPGLDAGLYWAVGALAAVLFFGSLLAHELSHAIVARREGLTVSGITLWLLGGVAQMDGDARSPGAEARIAGVGPLTSFALAAAFAAAAAGLTFAPPSDFVALATASAAWLALVNLVLGLFNLLPGAPLDGGRIMRATLWRLRQDKLQATRWATGLGQLLGYALLGIGILRVLSGDVAGIWFVLLGFFLSGAASAERRSTELLESLRGTRVGDIMTRQLLRVPSGLTVETFAAAAAEGRTSAWLVVGPGGHVTGVLGPMSCVPSAATSGPASASASWPYPWTAGRRPSRTSWLRMCWRASTAARREPSCGDVTRTPRSCSASCCPRTSRVLWPRARSVAIARRPAPAAAVRARIVWRRRRASRRARMTSDA